MGYPDFYILLLSSLECSDSCCNQIVIVLSVIDSHLTPRRSVWYLGGRALPRLRYISMMTMVMGGSGIETVRLAAVYSPVWLAEILTAAGAAFWGAKAEMEKSVWVYSLSFSPLHAPAIHFICVCLFLRSFSVRSFSFQLCCWCCCCRCGTRAAGGNNTWVLGSHNVWPRNRVVW